MHKSLTLLVSATLALHMHAGSAHAQPQEELGRYFGFEPARIVVVDDNCGPMVVGDFNNDGRPDLAVVNNRKSRIELHMLRETERTETELERHHKVNELPPSPWYDREDVSVPHRVTAIRAIDFDSDGKLDLTYVGANPSELVFLRQKSPGKFEISLKRRVTDLNANQGGFEIADVMGDADPELLALVDGRLNVFPIRKHASEAGKVSLGDPAAFGSSGKLAAFFVQDFNGDGLADVLGAVPEDSAPLRLWLQRQDPRSAGSTKAGLLNAELRFDLPALREAEPIVFGEKYAASRVGTKGASIGTIERASKRTVFYDLVESKIETGTVVGQSNAELQVQAEVSGFSEGENKDRSSIFADIDGDGLVDLLATDSKNNTLALYRQAANVGFTRAESFSAFKKPKQIVAGKWRSATPTVDVFVLSEDEKAVGVCDFDAATGRLEFPVPLPIKTPGAAPVSIGFVNLQIGGCLAVVVKDKRDHALELHRPLAAGATDSADNIIAIPLKDVSRPPQSMLSTDADQDGRADILLFTPNEPMIMLRAVGDVSASDADAAKSIEVLTDKQMQQFGLVQAAGPDNTILFDIDGDGKNELLIASENFVRACRYDTTKGWTVVEQITIKDSGIKLVGLSTLQTVSGQMIVAADKGNSRLVLIARDSAKQAWDVKTRLRLDGFPIGAITAGNLTGAPKPSGGSPIDSAILCLSSEAFAIIRLEGTRYELFSFAAYRPENENRLEHDLEAGDVNGDGFLDIVALDASEQMCEIFTFSASRKLLPATEFEVYQSRLFRGGSNREYEPRDVIVADVTGDQKDDIILLVHDRLIICPQMTKPSK